ncbi:FxSxx-COOH system tetratricopeptide repeat protein [Streptomyces griseoaurantiacus]|uniref:Chromosome partitioning ATPase, Mrp family, contains Fe-S cluster n=1 Tax=Streptomyces griseoaurantiacus TaxID=68213 RepID=A0A1G7M084_9ACTN|nr:FxSxx-COOH system tetratricopeptide repeat protein [Streptomyces jietaisiensis]SDF55202.1 Chromosome partitioning ATPase, Mrp family, contains Fe-S cluster [Streptomyces jietaisiensis]
MKFDSGDAGTAESGTIVTFYSFKGGTGRTMSLANVAWILASNGKRVLVMDWDLEAPGLHRYFTPFLGDPDLASTEGLIDLVRKFELRVPRTTDEDLREYARVERYATTLTTTFPDGGYIDFVSSGKQTEEYSETINTYDWRGFYERRDGAAFLHALREDMRRNYDYVLIDSRTGFGDTSGITTMMLPDVLVNCFTLNTQSVDGGADIARDVKRGAPHVKIIPVPMRVDYAEQEKLEASRDHARRRFQEFLKDTPRAADPDSYWGAVEIPYRSYFAYEEVLATVADTPRQPASLLAAYERLTATVTDGAVTTLQAPDEQTRRQMLARFQRVRMPGGGLVPRVRLDFAVRDGAWAEWLAAQMQAAGIAVTLRASSPSVPPALRPADSADVVIALLSPDFATTSVADEIRALAAAPEGPRIIGLRTREYTPEPALRGLPGFVLVDVAAAQALNQVFGLLDLEPPTTVAPEGPAYPGLVPKAFNVPPRNNSFTGRDLHLDRLRNELGTEALRQDTPVGRVFLYGLGGIGKTQIAQEYVHRYGSQYDVVHWIPAEQPETIPPLLAELGTELGLRGESVDELVQATLAALRTGLAGRWLLVFDNIESQGPDQADASVEQYIPVDGPGHVIVTARRSPMGQNQSAMEIDAFNRSESVALLRRRVDGMTAKDANRIADTLGDFPMAMEMAAAWLRQTGMPLDTYLELVDSRVSAVLSRDDGTGGGPQQSLTAVWRLSVDRLAENRPAAVRLLELCSFLSPEPIAHSLLYSDGMRNYLAEVTGDTSVFDPMVMGYLIRDLGRYALATVDQRNRFIQVHRLLQAAVREWLEDDPARYEQIRHRAQLVLAGALPSAALPEESPQVRQRMAELLPHLDPSGAVSSTDPRVCEWVIRQVRNQWLIGDHRAAAALGRRALRAWTQAEALGRDHPLTLRVAAQAANPLRSLGLFQDAYELDEDTLRRQREQLGRDNGHTLVTARNYGADLRGLGRYQEAYESDQETYELCRNHPDFGEDNEATLRAGNNLAVSLNLAGRPADGLALAKEVHERSRTVLGQRNRRTLNARSGVALDLREMGEYQASLDELTALRKQFVELQDESNDVLRTDASLAVTQRRLGNHTAAEALTRTTLNSFQKRYGELHPDTMSCGANLACDLLALSETNPDRRAEALELGKRSVQLYQSRLGADHPFTLAAATNLVAILRNQDEATEALKLGDDTLRQLVGRLGEQHPAAVACRANRAGALSALGRHREATAEDEKVHEAYLALYGPDHPRVLCARYNAALERILAGDEEAETALREAGEDAERKLGPRHPTCRAMVNRRRIDFDLEMPPI